MSRHLIWLSALAATILAPAAQAASLLKDGSFETPPPPSGTFTVYNLGQKIGPWTVVGPSGSNVAVVSTSTVIGGFSFPAKKGVASLDLTGGSDPGLAQGVSQTIKTVAGKAYSISFYVGNINDPGGIWGTTSTVNVFADGKPVISATNSGGKPGGTVMVWQKFSAHFTAASATTTLSFISGDLIGHNDEICGLDAVTVVPAAAP